MRISTEGDQLTLFDLDSSFGKTSPEPSPPLGARTSGRCSKKSSELRTAPHIFLDLTPGAGNLLGLSYWEESSAYLGELWTLNTGPAPLKEENVFTLSRILQENVPRKYYLSRTACLGILRRAKIRKKELPPRLEAALILQAGVTGVKRKINGSFEMAAFTANQRNEVRDLHDIAGALQARPGMKRQTFVAGPTFCLNDQGSQPAGVTEDATGALSENMGSHHPLVAQPGCLTPWDTQQERIFLPDGTAPTLTGADGGGGRNPAGLVFSAGFCAGASPSAGGIGYDEEIAPTLRAGESGTNMAPSILCLNDQGGKRMDVTENITATLRAQMDGHPPLVMGSQQGGAEICEDLCPTITSAAGMSGNNQPVLFENHDIDSRYTGPHEVAPTMSARYGTGGNNVPLLADDADSFCIAGNIIDREAQNGGNGFGYQTDICYTLTGADRLSGHPDKRSNPED